MSALLSFFLFCLLIIVVSVLYVGIAVYRKYRQLTDVFRRNTNNERNYRHVVTKMLSSTAETPKPNNRKSFPTTKGNMLTTKKNKNCK